MTRRVAIVGAALSDCGRVDTKSPFELHYQAASASDRRRRAHQGRRRRPRLERHGPARAGRDRRVPRACGPTWIDGTGVGGATWVFMVEHAVEAILAGHAEVDRARLRLDDARRPQVEAPPRQPRLRRPRPDPVRRAVRAHAHREVRDGDAPAHVRVRHHASSSSPRSRSRAATTPGSTPTRTTATRSRSTTSTASPMIADPLTKLHCCIRSDGGGAIVLTSEERAKDLPKRAGVGARHRRDRVATRR